MEAYVNKCYKVTGSSSDTGTSSDVIILKPVKRRNDKSLIPVPREAKEDAARVAARAIVVAERLNDRMLRANKKVKTLDKILEESTIMLEIAKNIHKQCNEKGMFVLKT
ncbi:uncharacterized protein [Rutidosis leptorrhynchoides]|uniref:uncharacterized protein n=1 Tax=Rutidosis leptorrhynchoides TaxID=125765 RepID=UPI003A99E6AC